MEIGKTIRKLRKAAGMDQKQFASALELSNSLISLIETGQREPSLSQLKKISRVLGVPVSILVFDPDQEFASGLNVPKEEVRSIHDLMIHVLGHYAKT